MRNNELEYNPAYEPREQVSQGQARRKISHSPCAKEEEYAQLLHEDRLPSLQMGLR